MQDNKYFSEKITYLTPFDKAFPEKLKDIPNPPSGIYVKGQLPDPNIPSVAIIGSRMASAYGISMARYFSSHLSGAGVQIISGIAKGVDGVGQRTAIEMGNPTFGVLGCGLNEIYPKENRDIFESILKNGGLISEYPPDTKPLAKLFPLRNRLISGLADIILVVEAGEHSGTSITVSRALEQGKDVFAVPGRITDPFSAGCNQLIRDGAGIALSPEAILNALGLPSESIAPPDCKKKLAGLHLAKLEKKVYISLDLYPKSIESILNQTGAALAELYPALLRLKLLGLISETGQNNYYRNL
ncbi:MAG: DNA-processing protein DprA [Lachnospiraceae bacterium]|nr:DNA-processing protein DprA [Lachnospiraceae bacterium]